MSTTAKHESPPRRASGGERLLTSPLLPIASTIGCTVYPKKYAHGFVVLCFVLVMQSFIMNSHEVFIHIHQGCFAGTGAIVRLSQCQWSKPDGYGKISLCITTTKHSKAKTVCIFLWIYCIYPEKNIWMNHTGEITNMIYIIMMIIIIVLLIGARMSLSSYFLRIMRCLWIIFRNFLVFFFSERRTWNKQIHSWHTKPTGSNTCWLNREFKRLCLFYWAVASLVVNRSLSATMNLKT